MAQPDNGEQALEITETMVRSGAVDIIIVDSVAALVPKAEIDGALPERDRYGSAGQSHPYAPYFSKFQTVLLSVSPSHSHQ